MQLIGYGPTGLVAVAVVVQDSVPTSDAKESPVAKPVPVTLNAGSGAPYTLVALLAVSVSALGVIVNVAVL